MQEAYARLRALKGEVEGAQRLVEKGRQRVQAEFEAWLASASAPATSEQAGEEEEEKVTGDCGPPTRRMSISASSLSLSAARGSWSASTTERKIMERGLGSLSASSSSSSSSSSSVLGLGQSQGQERGGRGDVDDDIAAFYRAKEELLALRRQREGGTGAC